MHSPVTSRLDSPSVQSQPIRTYVRIYPSNGLDPVPETEYEIVDGKTFIFKKNTREYGMHSFNYIFNNQFCNVRQVQHMNIVNDCLQGKDQLVIADIDKEYFQQFLIGSPEDAGFIISVFTQLFSQILYESKITQSPSLSRHKEQNISVSMFSTEGDSNKFTDLILGQKFTFYSKKDMDEHKDFYNKEIIQLRQFLIVLKIACLHYKQCCKQGDPFVVRMIVHSFDQVKKQHYNSIIHVVLCEGNSRIVQNICRKVQFAVKNGLARGEDHGSLANYLEPHLQKSKLIYIYGIPYRKSVMQNVTPMFNFLSELRTNKMQIQISKMNLSLSSKIQLLNNFSFEKPKFGSHNFSHRQIHHATKLLQKLCDFLNQVQLKWKSYCQIMKSILQIQTDFYERQRFPISLQIQQFNIKSFIISKVYRLSQTYQMDDLSQLMQKLRILKNQIYIAVKTLTNCKQYTHLVNNQNVQNFIKFYQNCVSQIVNNVKILFSFRYRCVDVYKIRLEQDIKIQSLMDSKVFKNLAVKLKAQAQKIQEKEEILLRKIDYQPEFKIDLQQNLIQNKSLQPTSRLYPIKTELSSSQTFELFKKHRRNKNLSNLPQITNRLNCPNPTPFTIKSPSSPTLLGLKSSLPVVCRNSHNENQDLSNSVIITRQFQQQNLNQYNFALPKLAIIRTKRGKR